MDAQEKELIEIVRNSEDPIKVMAYMVTIMTEWLKKNKANTKKPNPAYLEG